MTFLFVIPLLYLVYLGVGHFAGRVFMYPGAGLISLEPEPRPAGVEELTIDTNDGASHAWYFPSRTAPPAPLLVFFHGNGELISHNTAIAETYVNNGFAVLMPEYRGYYGSDGHPSQAGIVGDSLRFIELVSSRDEIDPSRIVYHGFSLGGGIAGAVTAEREPAALVLSSTFRSMGAMFGRYGLPGFVAPDPYPTARTIETIGCPVLVTHGSNDRIVPTAEGRRLGSIGDTRFFEFPAGHNDALAQPEVWIEIIPFVLEAIGPGSP
ncbi:MAG: alpha/beta fold hydrolase [Planctomycetota bacterium]